MSTPATLDPAVEARMLVAQAGGTRVSRGWTITATADICGLDHDLAEAWVDHACTIGLLDRNDATLRLAGAPNHRYQPLDHDVLAAAHETLRDLAAHSEQRATITTTVGATA